ncbi:hypothetical protein QOZ80_6BG0463320 [Eleusine coracana subsp. coracana]|nr:hypothetical protein QOZ80_6BG0463320 [Eleusine coracana subsp. coracana]
MIDGFFPHSGWGHHWRSPLRPHSPIHDINGGLCLTCNTADCNHQSARRAWWLPVRVLSSRPRTRQAAMEEDTAADHKRSPPQWCRTLSVQAALCLALYAAFSLGEPQLIPPGGGGVDALQRGTRGGGIAFLSVAGGERTAVGQARLLKQMEAITKVYEVKFVLDIAQLGEDDPLWQNGSMYFQDQNIPWYSTTSSHGQAVGNFLEKLNMPRGQVLDIIGLDTGSLQEPLRSGKISSSYREQTKWLERSVALARGNWKIVVGYNPLVVCNEEETPERTKFYVPFQRIFAKYEVNAYISTAGVCGYFHQDNSILYIGNPHPGGAETNVDGFFLHRLSPLEMESIFINVEGKVVQKSVVHPHGMGTM